jgi:hypothetical protein
MKGGETYSVTSVVGVNGNGGISQHRLGSGRGNDDLLIRAVDMVGEAGDDSKLELLVLRVPGDVKKGAAREDLLVDLSKRGYVKLLLASRNGEGDKPRDY